MKGRREAVFPFARSKSLLMALRVIRCAARVHERMLQVWPVSKRVNSSRANGDDATLIDKVAA
jgi:hypothetical protein